MNKDRLWQKISTPWPLGDWGDYEGQALKNKQHAAMVVWAGDRERHGKSKAPEYHCWIQMKRRCLDPNHPAYMNYGLRGIKICQQWKESFRAFYRDMGERPDGHSLERIDNNGDYEPSNCRWATRIEQQNNTRLTHRITLNGKTQGVAAWSRENGIKYGTIRGRVSLGWPIERVLSEPIHLPNDLRGNNWTMPSNRKL
jgi:hypothetical protein